MSNTVSAGSARSQAGAATLPPVRVVVVDDHPLLRDSIRSLLHGAGDMEWVGEAREGGEGVDLVARTRPDVVLMDLSMPGMNGIDATREMMAAVPTVRVIVLTTSTKGQDVHDAAAAGAVGFLSKGADPDDVLDAIRAAAHGGTAWDRRSTEILRQPG